MNEWLYRQLYFGVQFLRGEHVHRRLKELESTQWMPLQELKTLQWAKLSDLLEHSYGRSPHYRRKLDAAGLRPGDIKGPEDLSKLPLLTREEVTIDSREILIKGFGRTTVNHSSGTTGAPLTLYLSREALGYHHAAQWRGFSWYGLKPGQPNAKIWGYPLLSSKYSYEAMKDYLLKRLRLSAFKLSELEMSRFYEKCLRKRPLYLYGYASALARFADFVKTAGGSSGSWRPKVVISTSEILYGWQRRIIEDAFNCPVADEYGASEVGVIAFQCTHGGLHLSMENVYLEVLKLDSNEPVQTGEAGRVVVTCLRNFAFPVIRYDLGDCAALSEKRCACGRGLPLVESIQGRVNDLMLARDGSPVHSELLSYINRALESMGLGIGEYVVVQKSLERLALLVNRDTELSEEVERYMREQLGRFLGEDVQLTVERVDALPRDKSGKIRYFISEVAEGRIHGG